MVKLRELCDDENIILIVSLFLTNSAFSKVLIGDFASQDAALNVEKSCVPINNFRLFFINLVAP